MGGYPMVAEVVGTILALHSDDELQGICRSQPAMTSYLVAYAPYLTFLISARAREVILPQGRKANVTRPSRASDEADAEPMRRKKGTTKKDEYEREISEMSHEYEKPVHMNTKGYDPRAIKFIEQSRHAYAKGVGMYEERLPDRPKGKDAPVYKPELPRPSAAPPISKRKAAMEAWKSKYHDPEEELPLAGCGGTTIPEEDDFLAGTGAVPDEDIPLFEWEKEAVPDAPTLEGDPSDWDSLASAAFMLLIKNGGTPSFQGHGLKLVRDNKGSYEVSKKKEKKMDPGELFRVVPCPFDPRVLDAYYPVPPSVEREIIDTYNFERGAIAANVDDHSADRGGKLNLPDVYDICKKLGVARASAAYVIAAVAGTPDPRAIQGEIRKNWHHLRVIFHTFQFSDKVAPWRMAPEAKAPYDIAWPPVLPTADIIARTGLESSVTLRHLPIWLVCLRQYRGPWTEQGIEQISSIMSADHRVNRYMVAMSKYREKHPRHPPKVDSWEKDIDGSTIPMGLFTKEDPGGTFHLPYDLEGDVSPWRVGPFVGVRTKSKTEELVRIFPVYLPQFSAFEVTFNQGREAMHWLSTSEWGPMLVSEWIRHLKLECDAINADRYVPPGYVSTLEGDSSPASVSVSKSAPTWYTKTKYMVQALCTFTLCIPSDVHNADYFWRVVRDMTKRLEDFHTHEHFVVCKHVSPEEFDVIYKAQLRGMTSKKSAFRVARAHAEAERIAFEYRTGIRDHLPTGGVLPDGKKADLALEKRATEVMHRSVGWDLAPGEYDSSSEEDIFPQGGPVEALANAWKFLAELFSDNMPSMNWVKQAYDYIVSFVPEWLRGLAGNLADFFSNLMDVASKGFNQFHMWIEFLYQYWKLSICDTGTYYKFKLPCGELIVPHSGGLINLGEKSLTLVQFVYILTHYQVQYDGTVEISLPPSWTFVTATGGWCEIPVILLRVSSLGEDIVGFWYATSRWFVDNVNRKPFLGTLKNQSIHTAAIFLLHFAKNLVGWGIYGSLDVFLQSIPCWLATYVINVGWPLTWIVGIMRSTSRYSMSLDTLPLLYQQAMSVLTEKEREAYMAYMSSIGFGSAESFSRWCRGVPPPAPEPPASAGAGSSGPVVIEPDDDGYVAPQGTPQFVLAMAAVRVTLQSLETIVAFARAVIRPILGYCGFDFADPKAAIAALRDKTAAAKVLMANPSMSKLATAEVVQADLLACMRKCAELPDRLNTHPDYVSALDTFRMLNEKVATYRAAMELSGSRMEPVCVMLRGSSGAGKDNTACRIARDIGDRIDGTPWTSYSRNVADQHWSGYCRQPIVIFQEVFQNKDMSVRNQEIVDFLNMVSQQIFLVSGAAITDKGQPFDAKLILCTSNVKPGVPLVTTVEAPEAVDRRLTLDVEVVREHGVTKYRIVSLLPQSGLVKPPGDVWVTYPQLLGMIIQSIKHKMSVQASLAAERAEPEPVQSRFIPRTPTSRSAGIVAQSNLVVATPVEVILGRWAPIIAGAGLFAAFVYAVYRNLPPGWREWLELVNLGPVRFAELQLRRAFQNRPTMSLGVGLVSDTIAYVCSVVSRLWEYIQVCRQHLELSRARRFIRKHWMALCAAFGAAAAVAYGARRLMDNGEISPEAAHAMYDSGGKARRFVRPFKVVRIRAIAVSNGIMRPQAGPVPVAEEDIEGRIRRNVIEIVIHPEGCVPTRQYLLYLLGSRDGFAPAVTMSHSFLGLPEHSDPETGISREGMVTFIVRGKEHVFPLSSIRMWRSGSTEEGSSTCNDYLFLEAPDCGIPRSGIEPFLVPDSHIGGTYHGRIIFPDDTHDLGRVHLRGKITYPMTAGSVTHIMHADYALQGANPTEPGMCGAPYFDVVTKRVFGIHCAGSAHAGYGVPITSDMLNVVPGFNEIKAQSAYVNPIVPRCPAFPATDFFPGVKPKSTVRRTELAPVPTHSEIAARAASEGVVLKEAVLPRFPGTAKDLYDGIDKPATVLDPAEIEFGAELAEELYGKTTYPRQTLLEAIRESPKDTSPGPPWCFSNYHQKADLFNADGTPKPELLKSMHMLNDWLEGADNGYNPAALHKEKDELAKPGKKPRDIVIVPTEINLALQMVFGNWRRSLIENNAGMTDASHFACGINPYSQGWKRIHRRFFRRKWRKMASDCRKLDRNITADKMALFFDQVASLIEDPLPGEIPFNPSKLGRLLIVLSRIVDDMIYLVDMGNPSGNYLTVQINDFAVALDLCIAMRNILIRARKPHALANVLSQLDWISFGDDTLVNIDPESGALPGELQVEASKYGTEYTWDDKLDHPPDYEPEESEITFLKRSFVPLGPIMVLAPLSKQSILSCLAHRHTADKTGAQYSARCCSMLREACLHGKEFYEWCAAMVARTHAKLHIVYAPTGVAGKIRSYDDIRGEMELAAQREQTTVLMTDEYWLRLEPVHWDPIEVTAQSRPCYMYGRTYPVVSRSRARVWHKASYYLSAIVCAVAMFIVWFVAETPAPTPTAISGSATTTTFIDPVVESTPPVASPEPLHYFDALLTGSSDAPSFAIQRPFKVASASFSTTDARESPLLSIPFPDALFSIPFIADKIRNYRYFRAGVKVTIRVNGNKFLYGTMIVGWDPATSLDATASFEVNTYSISGGPHLLVDVSKPIVEEFDLPWIYPFPCIDVATFDSGCMGTVDIVVLNPLTPVSTSSAVVTIPVDVYAQFVDVVLDGPTDNTTLSSTMLPPDSYSYRAGPRSRVRPTDAYRLDMFGSAGSFAEVIRPQGGPRLGKSTAEQREKSAKNMVVSAVKTAADFLTPLIPRPIVDVVGTVAYYLGFDLPRNLQEATRIVPVTCPGLPLSSGLDNSIILSRLPARKPFVIPGLSPPGIGDEMNLAQLASIPSLLGDFQVIATDAPDSIIQRFPVNPRCVKTEVPAGSSDLLFFHPTHLSKVTTPFQKWRGTLRYKVYVTCSEFHSFRIRAAFIPLADNSYVFAPGPLETVANVVIDINGSQDFELSIPFLFPRPYATQSIGQLVFQMINPPGPVGDVAVAPVFFQVYVAGASDLEVAEPSGHLLIPADSISSTTAQARPRDDFLRESFMPIHEGATSVVIGDGPYVHDMYNHISDLTRQPQPWLANPTDAPVVLDHALSLTPQCYFESNTLVATAPTATYPAYTRAGNMTSKFKPEYVYPLSSFASQIISPAADLCRSLGYLEHFADCYKFQVGGFRIKVVVGTTNYDTKQTVIAAREINGTWSTGELCKTAGGIDPTPMWPVLVAGTSPYETSSLLTVGAGAVEATIPGGTRVVEFEVPFKSSALFHTTGMPAIEPGITSGTIYQWTPDNCVMVAVKSLGPVGDEIAAKNWSMIYRSVADDHRFMCVKGCKPSLYVITRGNSFTPGAPGAASTITPSGMAYQLPMPSIAWVWDVNFY